jgi:F-type H+-transporting ATPase subunit gamma
MASLNQIKKRIKYVNSAKKITKAMYLVATAKLRKCRDAYLQYNDYQNSVLHAMQNLASRTNNFIFMKNFKEEESTIHIIINSDIGLCGAYNSSVNKLVKQLINQNDKVICIGTKAFNFWKPRVNKENLILTYKVDSFSSNYNLTSILGRHLFDLIKEGKCNKVLIHYTKFVNSIKFIPTTFQLLPLDKAQISNGDLVSTSDTTNYEPSLEDIINDFMSVYINGIIHGAILESKISENSSRRNAMDKASESADELRKDLMLKYNRKRQLTITNEISEITAGSNT